MIRVLLRHTDDEDGVLVGDFPPSEIAALKELFSSEQIYYDDLDDVRFESAQWVKTGGRGSPRMVLELLVGDSA